VNKSNSAIFLLSLLFPFFLSGQTNFDKAWSALDNANLEEAESLFELAKKDNANKTDALIALCLINSQSGQLNKARTYFREYMKEVDDPYPVLYALFKEPGVMGEPGKALPKKLSFLNDLLKDEKIIDKQLGELQYRKFLHELLSNKPESAAKEMDKLKNLQHWERVGPFDNVMNSGFNKVAEPLAHPEANAKFTSKYGSEISWFDPKPKLNNGYVMKTLHFKASNSIVYSQTFVESPIDQEVIFKLGHTGSLKLWVNDDEVYKSPENLSTEMDYIRYKVKLYKGFNRILVQLGDYQRYRSSFIIRISDLNNNILDFNSVSGMQPYKKGTVSERIPHFGIEGIRSRKGDARLNQLLMAMAWSRSSEVDQAEPILKAYLKDHPDNYFFLRQMIVHLRKKEEQTSLSQYYDQFENKYSKSHDILVNKIQEYFDEKDKAKFQEAVDEFLDKYPNKKNKLVYEIQSATLNEENVKILELIEKFYREYPNTVESVNAKYQLLKGYYGKPKEAKALLYKYIEDNYDYGMVRKLCNSEFDDGNTKKVIELLENSANNFPDDDQSLPALMDIYYRQENYSKAVEIGHKIVQSKPNDHTTLQSIGQLYRDLKKPKLAIEYYEKALDYYPFDFNAEEKLRELKKKKAFLDIIPDIVPNEIIAEFEENYKQEIKESYDVVYERKSRIIYKNSAKGLQHDYILRINNEDGLNRWSQTDFSASSYMTLYFDELKVISKAGKSINAERNGGNVVFTNLEIGDYIYISYHEIQTNGGKSSLFVTDQYSFESYVPFYHQEYNVYLEKGGAINFKFQKEDLKPEITEASDYTHYRWKKMSSKVIKNESLPLPFSDIANTLHLNTDYSWSDIVQWYSDLTAELTRPNSVIKTLAKDLFEGNKAYQPEEKAKIIYDFICQNIQYSSVDFRQSGYIPQKASNVYLDRLGDCKDVSTLFSAIAKEVGLKANLVLINTADNGKEDIILPSLNFNHCIVKVYLPKGEKYLELTDPHLPFGHLYYYHQDASILEIPSNTAEVSKGLERLQLNKGYQTKSKRTANVSIQKDGSMNIDMKVLKTGKNAASMTSRYYDQDKINQKDNLKNLIDRFHKSAVKIVDFDLSGLKPGNDQVEYTYNYEVENDILKMGSFRSIKVPFSDVLVEMSIFEDEERINDLYFVKYEDTDIYEHHMNIKLQEDQKFKEFPENIELNYKGFTYSMKVNKISEKEIEISRIYKTDSKNIKKSEYLEFKDFMSKLSESENLHLLF